MAKEKSNMTFEEYLAKFQQEPCFDCNNKSKDCPECGGDGFYIFSNNEMYTKAEMKLFFEGTWTE